MQKWNSAFLLLLLVGLLSACGIGEERRQNMIIVGASAMPHAEILDYVKDKLAEQGIEMQVQTFDDYVLPNTALQDKQIDANYFQTVPYLKKFNQQHNTTITALKPIHFEPMGLYPGKQTAEEPRPGAVIGIPSDVTNSGRALKLLERQGWIALTPGKDINSITKQDVIKNPKKIQLKEMEGAVLSRAVTEVDYAVVNGNYALQAGLDPKTALEIEKKGTQAAQENANIIAVREGDEKREAIRKLIEVLRSEDTKKYIEEEYKGAVVPVF